MLYGPHSLILWNAFFAGGIALLYVFVTRRRLRTYLLVDHLAALSARAMPIAVALRMVADDLGGVFGMRLDRAARGVEEGRSLEEALAAAPGAVPPLVRRMIVLGERSGNMAAALAELRRSYRRAVELPGRSVYHFIYPLLLAILVVGAAGLLHGFVLPRFDEIFAQTRLSPRYAGWATLVVAANRFVFLAFTAVLVVLLLGGGSRWLGSGLFARAKDRVDAAAVRIPWVGATVRDASASAFAFHVALMLRAGAPLADAVREASAGEGNRVLAEAYARAGCVVEEGGRLSDGLRREPRIPPALAWIAESGEASGSLPDALEQASEHLETKSRFASLVASRTTAPFVVLVVGSLVLGTSMLVFLPLRDMLEGVGAW